jgi:hypothetical protein
MTNSFEEKSAADCKQSYVSLIIGLLELPNKPFISLLVC